jgi:centriolar protein POC1
MVWNFKPTMRPFRFVGHKGHVHDVKVSPVGNIIASASADHTIRLWNNSVEGHSQVIKSHSAPVRSLSFSFNGQLLLSGSDDKQLKVFQVADRKFLFSI